MQLLVVVIVILMSLQILAGADEDDRGCDKRWPSSLNFAWLSCGCCDIVLLICLGGWWTAN